MLRNFSFKRYFLSWIIVLNVICVFFILSSEKIFASIDGEANCHLWTVSEIDSNGNMELKDYKSDGIDLKSIVVPNAADFKASNPTKYANLQKIYIEPDVLKKVAKYVDQDGGEFKISKTSGQKVFAGNPNNNDVSFGYLLDNYKRIPVIDLENLDTSNVTDMHDMFNQCTNLKKLNISNLNTSKVMNMGYMFNSCSNLVELDLNSWDTSNVANASFMFCDCTNLKKLNVSNWKLTSVTSIDRTFKDTINLKFLDLNDWNLNENIKNQLWGTFRIVDSKKPLLVRTRDNVLKNYNYNRDSRTFFTTTLKIDGDFAKFKIDPDEENVSYSDDKKEKYIIIYPTYTTTDSEEEIMHKLKNRLIEERDKIEFKNGEKIDWVPEENYHDVADALGGTYMIGAEKYSATLKVDGKIAKFKENNNSLEPGNYNSDRTEKYVNIYVMPTANDDKKIVWTKLKKVLKDEKGNIEIDKNYAFVKWNPEINESQEPNQSLGTYVVKTKGYLIEDVNFSWPQLKSSLKVGDSISIKDLFSITDAPNIPEGCKLIYKIGDDENSYWVEYLASDILVFDKSGECQIYLKIDGGENYFDKEYEKNNSKYVTLKIIGEDEEEKKESDTLTEGTGWFYWETISDGKKTLKDIGFPNRLQTAKYLEGYSDGTIKPNNNVTRAEFANMIYKLMCDEKEKVNTDVLKDLNDVKSSDWYGTSVAYVLDKKIFDTGKNFRPDENVTRGEVAEVVYNVIKFYDAAKTKEYDLGKHYYNFTDLSGSVSDIIKQLASHGIVNGYEDKTFKQNNNITRAEVTKIIFMAFDRKNNPGQKKYSDLDKSHWAYKFLMDASE